MRGLLAAIGFLTRIPVPRAVFADADAARAALPWYPLAGLLLGALLGVLAWLLHGQSPLLVAALLLTAWVALTGGLHLDGLADSADAWVGGLGDRNKTLAIMKDPSCGPVGVVSLVLVLLLKFAALASLGADAWRGLMLAALLGRAVLVAAFLTTPYVRPGGLGSALTVASRRHAVWGLLAVVPVAVLLGGWRGLLVLTVAAGVTICWRSLCCRRLGGMTGDTCGALTELVETAVLVAACLIS